MLKLCASFFQDQFMQSQQRQNSAISKPVSNRLNAETEIEAKATAELVTQRTILNRLQADGAQSSKAYVAASNQAKFLQDQIAQSQALQKGLIKDKTDAEIQGQQKIQELMKSQLDTTKQRLQSSRDEQASSIINFAKLGQIEKQQAIDALNQARKKGGASLDDTQKDLLRSVGTKESIRLANEGDAAESKKFGYNEKSFGKGFDKEQAGLTKAKLQLEANLSTTYDVSVNLKSNAEQVVTAVTDRVAKRLDEEHAMVMAQVEKRLQANTQSITISTNDKLQALRKNRS